MYVEKEIQKAMVMNTGDNLYDYSNDQPILLVFLRHFGCVFCKEAMRDIAKSKIEIRDLGVEIVFVHMATNEIANKYFNEFDLAGCKHISDIDKRYYSEFGLRKGSFTQLYGLQTWFRGFAPENKENKLEVSKSLGDATQMPGIFHILNGKILESYIHKLASVRPDYLHLVECCLVR